MGEDPKRVEALLKDDPEALQMFREAMTTPHGGDRATKNDIVILAIDAEQGNSRAYTLTRLKQHAPVLYERVVAGDLSAHAAAIEAEVTVEGWKVDWQTLTLIPVAAEQSD